VRPKLTSLRLREVNLRFCKDAWLPYLNLVGLQTLTIEYCIGADVFLDELTAAATANPPRLRKLTVVHEADEDDADEIIEAVDELLKLVPGTIQTLELCLRNVSDGPSESMINRHKGSLRHLLLDIIYGADEDGNPDYWFCLPEGLSIMLSGCDSLSQLALAFATPVFVPRNGPPEESTENSAEDSVPDCVSWPTQTVHQSITNVQSDEYL